MKKIIAILLAMLTCISLVACGNTNANNDNGDVVANDSNVETEEGVKQYPEKDYGLNDYVEFKPVSQNDRIMEGTYVKVSDVAKEHVQTETNGWTYLLYSTPQFELAGIKDPAENGGEFYRLDALNKNNYNSLHQTDIKNNLATHTSGVTLRFRTNADKLLLYASKRNAGTNWNHASECLANGFDIYVGTGTDRVYCGGVGQVFSGAGVTKQTVELPEGYKEILINFPTYSGVENFFVGLPTEAEIAEPLERTYKPIVFYGSSITQGACAARAGTAFFNVVTRMLNADCINQGYSSGAWLDTPIANYIADLEDIGAVVIDNDGNGDVPTMKSKHYNFYKTIRKAHPDIPILIVTRPIFDVEMNKTYQERYDVLKATYDRAVKEGDKNVYFVSGYEFMEMRDFADLMTADNNHPNDLGMYYMACSIYETLAYALEHQTKS